MSDEQTQRIDRLEEALAHHEVTVHDLSDEIAKQWQTIERLTRHVKELEEKLENLRTASGDPNSGDQPPPHY